MLKTSQHDKLLKPDSAEELGHMFRYAKHDDRIDFSALNVEALEKALKYTVSKAARGGYAVSAELYNTPAKLIKCLLSAGANPKCIDAGVILSFAHSRDKEIFTLLQNSSMHEACSGTRDTSSLLGIVQEQCSTE